MEETLIDVTELFDIKIMNQVYAQACIRHVPYILAQLVATILAKMKKSLVLLAFNPFLLRWYCLLTTNLNFKYLVYPFHH